MSEQDSFERQFQALTGRVPFAWQRRLFERMITGETPEAVDIPTGLGKTSAIAVWLLALAHAPDRVPRRLVYVVNRRTVVDQATREAEALAAAVREHPGLEGLRAALGALGSARRLPDAPLLAISTLRGQHADNGAWRQDPTRPAIVLGTVDMIGSRLLFSGYGVGSRSRAVHAGLLGKDALLVHDEAHLEPAFQALVTALAAEQARSEPERALRILALTATPRSGGGVLGLALPEDLCDETVRRRFHAAKSLRVVETDDPAGALLREARALAGEGAAVIVFLRSLDLVEKVRAGLEKHFPGRVSALTGTLRGAEREEQLLRDPIFARFLPDARRDGAPAFLVCTSAGEVGANLSADHGVMDLSTWDSLAQRLGRINRFGAGEAEIRVVVGAPASGALAERLERARALLERLPPREDGGLDASPAGLASLPPEDRAAAFAPGPALLPIDDVLLDAWAMTTPAELPGRPPVADWLHGRAEWEPPTLSIAWRQELDALAALPPERAVQLAQELLDAFPLKPQELLTEQVGRAVRQLTALRASAGGNPWIWLLRAGGEPAPVPLDELLRRDPEQLRDRTLLLPCSAGGLSASGLLDGHCTTAVPDVAESWAGGARKRLRPGEAPPPGMRRVATLRFGEEDGEVAPDEISYWVRPELADEEGSREALSPQTLAFHLGETRAFAEGIAEKLLPAELGRALALAAGAHDLGKDRAVWQRAIGNRDYPRRVLAKSGGRGPLLALGDYRHELGSLHDLGADAEWSALSPEARDLALHLIAAHHGRARPGFPASEGLDPGAGRSRSQATAAEVLRRFDRMLARHGRWGLAWLEALLRAADALGSQARETKEGA